MSSNPLDDSKLFRHVVEDLPAGIYLVDRDRKIRFWNHGAEHITGYLAHEVVGHVLEDVVQACDRHGNSFSGEQRPVTVTLTERRPQQCTAFFLHKSGHRVPVDVRTLPIRALSVSEQGGAIDGATVLFEEVFAYREESSGPAMYGCLDATTRIPSRRLTQALLNECMAVMEESNAGFGLLRIRVLGLEEFRAKHGAQSVVPFLRTAARTLRHSLDTEYFLGCWGENEFLAVLPSASPVTVATTAETLFNLLSHSEILWWGDRFLVKSEVAYTLASAGKNLEGLLREMKPAHSSATTKAAAAGAANDSVRSRG
ncbi:MAG: PAS domain-containing protein [Terriglobales bacterium]|jgi:PAS domain S-box-containing protein